MVALHFGRGRRVAMEGWRHSNEWLFTTMLLSALVSLAAAFELSRDAVLLAADPQAALACNFSQTVSCGTVALSWQASLFGFPNAFLGMVCEPVVVTIAVAGLMGVRFPRAFMTAAQAVYLAGLAFAYWLFFQSAFSIHAFCPWCLLITVGTTLVFFTLLHYNVREANLPLPGSAQRALEAFVRVGGDLLLAVLLLVGVAAVIFINYGSTLFGG